MAGAFCVLEKEGLGFLQFILVLRASQAKNTDYCGRSNTNTPKRVVIYTVRPHKKE